MAKNIAKHLFFILVYIFAAIGFALTAGYFAIRFGLTNESGIIDQQREAFLGTDASGTGVPASSSPLAQLASVVETVTGLKEVDPNADARGTRTYASAYDTSASPVYVGPWQGSPEWQTIEIALRKDGAALGRASADSGVPARLIAANLVAEQLRLFFTDREDYKKFFYPLKILGPQSQFSWGVMGMKEVTAVQVEANLKNPASPYYLGPQYEHLLDFPPATKDIARARFVRMTDQHDHYWSYLYAGLYMKEVEAQWERAGFPIAGNVAVESTLYNIGFAHSIPNPNPQVGGAAITLSDGVHSFGAIGAEFYNSDLLADVLPR